MVLLGLGAYEDTKIAFDGQGDPTPGRTLILLAGLGLGVLGGVTFAQGRRLSGCLIASSGLTCGILYFLSPDNGFVGLGFLLSFPVSLTGAALGYGRPRDGSKAGVGVKGRPSELRRPGPRRS